MALSFSTPCPQGQFKVEVVFHDETFWLNHKAMSQLFGVAVPAISKHLRNVFETGELAEEATLSKMETVQFEDDREIRMTLSLYNLDETRAVGYRVNSLQATSQSS
jgi:hypothetical protein